jgi:nucleotide-binding universal stress UspA family protein
MTIVGSYFDKDFESESSAAAAKDLASAVSDANIDAKKHVLAGAVYDAVIHLASKLDVDLIVIGAHQPELRHYLLGSNASRVVRHSKSSVLVLR